MWQWMSNLMRGAMNEATDDMRFKMELKIPVYITGMSYGSALSKAAKVALARAASKMGTATNTGEA